MTEPTYKPNVKPVCDFPHPLTQSFQAAREGYARLLVRLHWYERIAIALVAFAIGFWVGGWLGFDFPKARVHHAHGLQKQSLRATK